MTGKKKITVTLTATQAKALINGIEATFDFSLDYYMFSPGPSGYSTGYAKKNDRMLDDASVALTILTEALVAAGHERRTRY
jgi:hypothetical protein